MRKSLILISALALLGGLSILSCQSKTSVNAPDNTNKECPMKKADKTCTCNEHEGKGLCSTCQENQKKVIEGFEELNEKVVDCLQAGNYDKALETIQVMNNKFPANPLVLYNMTCVYSLMNKPEIAIPCLRDAVKCGWKNWKYMDDDADLDNIKDKDDYKKIRDELKKSSPDDSDENSDDDSGDDFEDDSGE
ncbi:MAG: hypothetical protein V1871_09340 [Planctomycetota bacterium]